MKMYLPQLKMSLNTFDLVEEERRPILAILLK